MTFSPSPVAPVRQRGGQTLHQSPHLFELRARDGLRRNAAGEYLTRSGHRLNLSRAATSSVLDSNGDSITVPAQIPALTITDGEAGLLLGGTDLVYCDWGVPFREMSGTLEFVQQGTPPQDTGWWYIGPSGNSSFRLLLIGNASKWRMLISGATDSVASLAVGPIDGQVVTLHWVLENISGTSYRVGVRQALDGGAFGSLVYSSAVDMSGAWAASNRHYLGSFGGSGATSAEIRKDLIAADPAYDWSAA